MPRPPFVDMQRPVDGQDEAATLRNGIAQLLPELRAAARLLTASRAEADDLVQDALLRMLKGLHGFAPPPEHAGDAQAALRPWGLAVLRNAFREGTRRARRERRQLAAAGLAEEGQGGGQEASAAIGELARALTRLPPALREAVVLVGAQGLSNEEAARICRVPVGTMKARLSRGRQALSRALGHVTG